MLAALRSLVLTLACTAALAAAGELALRAAGFWKPLGSEPGVVWSRSEDRELFDGSGLHAFDRACLWSPRPGARVEAARDERINERGYRGPLLELDKRAGVLRIALVGDAPTFGRGVAWNETFAARLPQELEALGVRAEVLDAGVSSSTLPQGLGRYRALVRAHRPDVLVCAYDGAVELLPAVGASDAQKLEAFAAARTSSRVARLAAWLPAAVRGTAWARLHADLQREAGEREAFVADPSAWNGPRRASPAEFAKALSTLSGQVAADGARLVLLVPPRLGDASAITEYVNALSACGAPLVELGAVAPAWHARAESESGTRTELAPDGHRAVARALAARIAELLRR